MTNARYPNRMAEWLVEQIDAKGWSNREAARRIGVNHVTIGSLIDGTTRDPSFDTLEKIAQAFGADARTLREWLRNSQDDPKVPGGLTSGRVDDGDIRESPMGRIARFANPRLRLAFYDALALAEGLTDEEAEALADDLEEVAREEKARHAHRSTDS